MSKKMGGQYGEFRKVAYDYEAELQDARTRTSFIEMYEEVRREDNYLGP